MGVTLVSSNSIDDGAVFYLNGVEVGRRRVSAGQNYLTTADNQGNEGIVEPILFSSASLMQGPNVMAVEVHQFSVTSSDIAFGMTLTARTLCTPPVITTQPSDATVTQCPTATFTVAATGSAPLAYVWCRDGVVIGGAINASYTTPPLALTDDGKVYTVKITNPCGTVTSAGAVLHVARPPNDTPVPASALTAPATVSGSLLYAGTTPPGVVGTFPPLMPTFSQQNAPDVWYSFSPTVDGVVTVDTCGAANCPGDTVLAVYQGSPAALLYNPSGLSGQNWYNDNMSPVCGLNPQAAQVKFDAKACTTYYIRVSARSANNPPGGFTLNLTQLPAPMPPNDACNLATSVSANSSTRFNNRLASTSATPLPVIYNDVWFMFVAPPLFGDATVETCATFNGDLAVYTGNNCSSLVSVTLTVVAASCPAGSMGLKRSFSVMPGQTYRVRVGGVTSTDLGCGFLRVSSGLPPANTLPAGNPNMCKTYTILGRPSGQDWSWSLTSPMNCRFNIKGNVAGVPSTGTALDIATAFANRINFVGGAGLMATPVAATPARPEVAYLKICTPCAINQVVLKVGPSPGTPDCWVANQALLGAITPCVFNPGIYEITDPAADPEAPVTDCNGNGQSDYVDIATGISLDADGNGVPDECPLRLDVTYAALGNEVVITWAATEAVLEQSANVTGPWSAVAGAASPYAIAPATSQKFFRLRRP